MASNDYSDRESPRDKEGSAQGDSKLRGRKRRKVSYLTLNKIYVVDYKDVALLRRFINERGKMLSTRQTGATASQQRQIARAVRRARELALLPYVVTDFVGGDRRDSGGRGRGRHHEARQAEQAPPPQAAEQAPQAVEAAPEVAVEAPAPEPVQAEQTAEAEA